MFQKLNMYKKNWTTLLWNLLFQIMSFKLLLWSILCDYFHGNKDSILLQSLSQMKKHVKASCG